MDYKNLSHYKNTQFLSLLSIVEDAVASWFIKWNDRRYLCYLENKNLEDALLGKVIEWTCINNWEFNHKILWKR